MFKGLKLWWSMLCIPPFTQEEIANTIERRKQILYVDYCKEIATREVTVEEETITIPVDSKEVLDRSDFDWFTSMGFVRSTNMKGEKCWYNRKSGIKVATYGLINSRLLSYV